MEELKKDFNQIKDQALVTKSPIRSQLSSKSVSDISPANSSPNSRGKADFSRAL